jgi:glucoamylase
VQAPGGPGAPPFWGPGRKQAFGAAPGLSSRVWLTVARGNLSEVFHPTLDRPALLGLRFIIAATGSPPVDDAAESTHDVRWVMPGIPSFHVESSHHEYSLSKDFTCDPDLDALIISGTFRPELPDLRLYLQASPHMRAGRPPNDAYVLDRDPVALVMRQEEVWMAVVGPFSRATAGYLNSSDLFVELYDNDGELTTTYESALNGNVAVGAELGTRAGAFQVAIGFGASRDAAEDAANRCLAKGAGQIREEFARAWHMLPDLPPNVLKASGDGGALARASLAVLRCLEDKTNRGAFIAAPAAPWGEYQSDGDQVYCLVWPRDLYQVATGLLDAGDTDAARRALDYLATVQRPDGAWPQNFTFDGRPHWNGSELDEVAFPILLAWRLGVAGALDRDPYPGMVRRAAAYLIANGPVTPLDRWEDASGLSPSTLAACVAALAATAEFADDAGEKAAAEHLRTVADYWQDRLDFWTYLRPFRHYIRIAKDPNAGAQRDDALGVDFAELVRRGLRRGDDHRIDNTATTVDVLLKVSLPGGPGWRRYAGDAYGESDDGTGWDETHPGQGRPWPLLTGERAHLHLAAGQTVEDLVRAMEAFAGPELILPEQVWDGQPLPQRGLEPGRATHSAAPLGWAHAEYLKVLVAIATDSLPDIVRPAFQRYAEKPPHEPAFVWSRVHAFARFLEGRAVRIQLARPGLVRWTGDSWATFKEVPSVDTGLDVWVAELPTQIMRAGAVMEWTAQYADGWEGTNHTLTCIAEPG